MRDIDLVEKAIADALTVLHVYIEAGPRSAEDSIQRLLAILDREDLVAALERLKQGYGPRVVK